MKQSELEEHFLAHWHLVQRAHPDLPEPVRQYRFHDERLWRLDFFWRGPLSFGVAGTAVEIDGGTWNGGAHGRGSGIQRNNEKRNAAALCGIRVLVYTSTDLRQRPYDVVSEVAGALGVFFGGPLVITGTAGKPLEVRKGTR